MNMCHELRTSISDIQNFYDLTWFMHLNDEKA
jgi:hypothetical protein